MSEMSAADPLFLFLADQDGPVLPGGLSADDLAAAPLARADVVEAEDLFDERRDPDDLARQRWGVIVPEDGGDELLRRIAPLSEARAREQGIAPADVRTYTFRRDLDATRWIEANLSTKDRARPRYLLLLGDLDQVSLELQQRLGDYGHFAGRLAFEAPEQYSAYADKVLAWETPERPRGSARVVLLTARSRGRDAPDDGYDKLMKPAHELAASMREDGEPDFEFDVADATPAPDVPLQRLLDVAADEAAPTLLWTMSHGLGGDRRTAGELPFGTGDARANVTAELVAERPFLPGGVWFMFACFGAGTPGRSLYWPWLMHLKTSGRAVEVDKALAYIPGDARPFVAAVPRAALANPRGPLAVVGHVDLAWSACYAPLKGAGVDPVRRFLRLASEFASADRRCRLGNAFAFFRELEILDSTIAKYVEAAEEARHRGEPVKPSPEYGMLWMQRQDLYNFILLGDPAVRLPVRAGSGE